MNIIKKFKETQAIVAIIEQEELTEELKSDVYVFTYNGEIKDRKLDTLIRNEPECKNKRFTIVEKRVRSVGYILSEEDFKKYGKRIEADPNIIKEE